MPRCGMEQQGEAQFGHAGNLDPILEERAGRKLELVGAMIDSYFGEIGRGIAASSADQGVLV